MKAKHAGFTVEFLQDQGMGSIRTVTKCWVTVRMASITLFVDSTCPLAC